MQVSTGNLCHSKVAGFVSFSNNILKRQLQVPYYSVLYNALA